MKNNLRHYRKMAQLTQEKLAQIVGCRRETIGQLEAGKYNPSLKLADKIAKTLKTSIYELFDLESKWDHDEFVRKEALIYYKEFIDAAENNYREMLNDALEEQEKYFYGEY